MFNIGEQVTSTLAPKEITRAIGWRFKYTTHRLFELRWQIVSSCLCFFIL